MSLHKVLVYVAFGWLIFASTMHFGIDILAQYLRHARVPGPETKSYYGLNTAYALGQVLFGILGLLIASRAMELPVTWPVPLLCGLSAVAWLAIAVLLSRNHSQVHGRHLWSSCLSQ